MTVRQSTESALVRHVYLRAECSTCHSSATWPASGPDDLTIRREERRKWVKAHRTPGHTMADGMAREG
ncbi:MAG TPA: hypothetical protein VGG32_02625 [Thermoplasmata archaeon]